MDMDRINMNETINRDGLARLINLKLTRLNQTNRAEAAQLIKGMVGAYDNGGDIIAQSLDDFFNSTSHTIN